jgi:nitrite reductase/ring-hydroxylating ferredoxin subunit
MAEFIKVAALAQLPPGACTTVTVGDTSVALFNVEGKVCAISDTCKHAGQSLGSGDFHGKVVRCRAHGWKYDVTTGFANGIDGFGVATYPVQVVDGEVRVAVD